jgi:hypothetical protein
MTSNFRGDEDVGIIHVACDTMWIPPLLPVKDNWLVQEALYILQRMSDNR